VMVCSASSATISNGKASGPVSSKRKSLGSHDAELFWPTKSATIQAAPAIERFSALPAQVINLLGSEKGAGNQQSKPMIIAVSNRDARRAGPPFRTTYQERINS
jgi:hypothetical protein